MTPWIILVSLSLALVRINGHKSQAYQATAHLWVGGLCGAWLTTHGVLQAWCVVALSVVELACFFVHPKRDAEDPK